MSNHWPVIFVHGILGFGPEELGPLRYWGTAFQIPSPLPRFEASLGPISSAHDRACELAAQIKGAVVDYGAAHAAEAGHARFGRDFSGHGFVPDWDEAHPVHLVGHSLGAPTIRSLQQLLAEDFWEWGSSQHWVRSISSISGSLNGSTATYFFGVDEETGLLPKDSGIVPMLAAIEVAAYATGGILDAIYDLDLSHWGFVRGSDESLFDFLSRITESNFFWGTDNAAYTLSLQGAYADNAMLQTYADTYYFAYVTEQSMQSWLTGWHYPEPLMNPALLAPSTYIGRKRFDPAPIATPGFESHVWRENDGLVSTYSQIYPHSNGSHPLGDEVTAETPVTHFGSGQWYTQWERNLDHLDICISPQLSQIGRQKRFYTMLLYRLAALES